MVIYNMLVQMVKKGVRKLNKINTAKLRGKRAEAFYSMETIAEKLGIARKSYENKEKGITEFTRSEIYVLIVEFKLSVKEVYEIFFAPELTEMLKAS